MSPTKLPSVASINTSTSLIGDSGASKHCIKIEDKNILTSSRIIKNGPKAILPNSTLLSSSHDGHLPIDFVSSQATHGIVYPNLSNASLLSIGQLCDDDCVALFTKKDLKIYKEGKNGKDAISTKKNGIELTDSKF